MPSINNLWSIVLAAGRSSRLRKTGIKQKKQFLEYKGFPLFVHSLVKFSSIPLIQGIVLVVSEEDFELVQTLLVSFDSRLNLKIPIVLAKGGELRQESVYNGLQCLPRECSHVFVHDAARPFFSSVLVDRILEKYISLENDEGVIPALQVKDTIKQVDQYGKVITTLKRCYLRLVQTPQLFSFELLKKAHDHARDKEIVGTDDASLVEEIGHSVCVVNGEEQNIKITTKEDLKMLAIPKQKVFITGFGYDVHKYGGDKPLILGGIPISNKIKVVAHSDGDVVFHALVDAILGCLGEGDIGELFPDSDKDNANLPSSIFVSEVLLLAEKKGFHFTHIDITIIAQVPKISPFKKQIQKNIANLIGLPIERVGLKATTEEGLGFTGRKEGIKAVVIVSGYFEFEEDNF